jgi:hypothetical protein
MSVLELRDGCKCKPVTVIERINRLTVSMLWKETDIFCDDKVIDADFMCKMMNTHKIVFETENLKYAIMGLYVGEREGLFRNVM